MSFRLSFQWVFLLLLSAAATALARHHPKVDGRLPGVWVSTAQFGPVTETVRFEFAESGRTVTGRSLRQLNGPGVNAYAVGSITGSLSEGGEFYALKETLTQRHPANGSFCAWTDFTLYRLPNGDISQGQHNMSPPCHVEDIEFRKAQPHCPL